MVLIFRALLVVLASKAKEKVPVLELVPVRVMVRVRRAVALGVVRRCEGKGLGVRVVVEW